MPYGIYEHKSRDIAGIKFGRLTAVKFSHKNKYGLHYWLVKCDCGTEKFIRKQNMELGLSNSCSCLQRDIIKEVRTIHGMSGTRFYTIWENIVQRTKNPKYTYYKNYGARGIKICDEWTDFTNFKNDMYESYVKHFSVHGAVNTTIDRINNNGNYCKENCKWATRKEQANNLRWNRKNKIK